MSAYLNNARSLTSEAEWGMAPPAWKSAEPDKTSRPADISSIPSAGYSGLKEHSSRLHTFLEYATLYMFPVLFLPNLYLSLNRLHELEMVWLIVPAIPISLVAADFVSGMIHWLADTYGSEDTPILGPGFVKPFRHHHLYPRDITTHHFAEIVGNVCVFAFPVLLLCLYLMWTQDVSSWLAFTILCVALMCLASGATNQFHKWAHSENPPAYARPLQRLRLVLAPAHHELHHTEPFESHYCITNGWLNPILNRIKFFRRLEIALAFLGMHTAKVCEQRELPRTVSAVSEIRSDSNYRTFSPLTSTYSNNPIVKPR